MRELVGNKAVVKLWVLPPGLNSEFFWYTPIVAAYQNATSHASTEIEKYRNVHSEAGFRIENIFPPWLPILFTQYCSMRSDCGEPSDLDDLRTALEKGNFSQKVL